MSGDEAHPSYRADIDGLRAIAVLAVIGFHIFPEWVAGGFVGVDIFFVISGFLISRIILLSLQSQSFSFATFYARRIRRIFPALILVLFASLAFGWSVLLADEFRQLGKHVAGAAGFTSNFVLWQEIGYFDTSSDLKPLLHLWSLGIEEQFYFVWPLLLWSIWCLSKKLASGNLICFISCFVAVGALVSFAICLYLIHSQSSFSFYGPHARFWELMIGALLAVRSLSETKEADISKSSSRAQLHGVLGLALVFISIVIIDRTRSFPGWWALLPTIGAALVIAAGSQTLVNRKLLSFRPLVWLGLISYPLYLWHWPLISYARILNNAMPSIPIRVAIIFVSLVLALLTYLLIERPIRRRRISFIQTLLITILMAALGALGYSCFNKEGFAERSVAKIGAQIINSGWEGGDLKLSVNECGIATKEGRDVFSNCFQDSRGKPKFAVIGDSRANFLYNGLLRTSTEGGRWLLIGGVNGTGGVLLPVLTNSEVFKPYQPTLRAAIDAITKNEGIETVLIAAAARNLLRTDNMYSIENLPTSPNYEIVKQGLTNVASTFVAAGKSVIIAVENPIIVDVKDCLMLNQRLEFLNRWRPSTGQECALELSKEKALTHKYRAMLEEVAAEFPGKVTIFDITDLMCDVKSGICPAMKNGHMMYSFTDHISDYAAGIIGSEINKSLNQPTLNSRKQ
jgi:peptidoglycan/LPS O-acetylase OafA/YrhL